MVLLAGSITGVEVTPISGVMSVLPWRSDGPRVVALGPRKLTFQSWAQEGESASKA